MLIITVYLSASSFVRVAENADIIDQVEKLLHMINLLRY